MTLTREEARERSQIVRPQRYEVELDLDRGPTQFASTTRLTFTARAGGRTFVDLDPEGLESATLNGIETPREALVGRRLELTGLAETNELVVTATMRYGRDGQGLHRAQDPADGQAYVYGHLFMDAAPRVYACFDQPDLKAPYDVTVRAPQGWTVVANGAMREVEPGLWRAATTKPLATYFVTVCAGPFATVTDEHDGIPLAVHARESLRDHLEAQAPQMLEVTKQSFDHYHRLFGIRYPFGEYHQVFVPEFNAGAMENPGCVTFRDQLIFTGAAGRTEHLVRANTISHEMAHMWFGDLVTMQWWDDLWLNESFAEYMANRTLVAATQFDDAWVDVAAGRKAWGYAAERSPSTHPVAGAPAGDTDTALQNFDGISYAKGSAVLRQLIHHIGDEAFIAGVRRHLEEHAFANATLTDFLGSLSATSGRDLGEWAGAWLETAGMDTLSIERSGEDVRLVITPDATRPARRTHTVRVCAFGTAGQLLATDELHDAQGVVRLPEITAIAAQAALVVPNAGDLTWAGVTFERESLAALGSALPGIEDATTRAMIWTALAHGLATANVAPQRILEITDAALAAEEQMPVLDVATTLLGVVVGRFLPWTERPAATQRLAALAERIMRVAEGADDARHLAGARLLASTGQAERLAPWFEGRDLPSGIDGDAPFRWRVARRLAQLDAIDVADLDAALAVDDTMSGRLGYLTARASLPDAETKAWAWQELTAAPSEDSAAHSNYEMNALASGFWSADDEATLAPYVERYVSDIPRMREWVGEDALARVAALAFPSPLAGETLDVEARRMLQADLPASVRRAMVDEHAKMREVLASRAVFSL